MKVSIVSVFRNLMYTVYDVRAGDDNAGPLTGTDMNSFGPVLRLGMADRLARRIKAMIRDGQYQQGDRLPTIMEMARRFSSQ